MPTHYCYRVQIAYKGTRWHGWQALAPHGQEEELPTVQGTIRKVLRQIAKYKDCSLVGTSRTDAGVHARCQIAKIVLPREIAPDKLMQGMNSMLPDSIRIVTCEGCPSEYNPKRARTRKTYEYRFSFGGVEDPLKSDTVYYLARPLDLGLMREGATLFIGEHDFRNYSPPASLPENSFRMLDSCEIVDGSGAAEQFFGDEYILRVSGRGFLKYMVRNIAGVLFELGGGRIDLAKVSESLARPLDQQLSRKAPCHGLCLAQIVSLES